MLQLLVTKVTYVGTKQCVGRISRHVWSHCRRAPLPHRSCTLATFTDTLFTTRFRIMLDWTNPRSWPPDNKFILKWKERVEAAAAPRVQIQQGNKATQVFDRGEQNNERLCSRAQSLLTAPAAARPAPAPDCYIITSPTARCLVLTKFQ